MRKSTFVRGGIVALIATVGATAAVGIGAPGAGAGDTLEERAERAEFAGEWSPDDVGARSEASPAALDPGQNIEFVALSPGCRMIDTRKKVGPFAAGTTRDYSAIFVANQGGLGSTCPVPENAVAVDVSLSTIGGTPTGSGFAQVGPAFSTPSATVLQYLKGQGTSVTTTIPLEAGAIRIKTNGAGAHLAADVLGYWQRTMHVSVDGDATGTILAASGLVDYIKDTETAGLYYFAFDRDISTCSASASPESGPDVLSTRVAAGIFVDEEDFSFVVVDVRAFDSQTDVDGAFELVIEC